MIKESSVPAPAYYTYADHFCNIEYKYTRVNTVIEFRYLGNTWNKEDRAQNICVQVDCYWFNNKKNSISVDIITSGHHTP